MNNILEMIKNEKVEWKKLGDVCEIGTGKSNTNQQVENGKYPFYVRSKDIKRIDEYEFDEEAIIIPGEGGIGEIYHYINGKYALHQRAYRIHVLKDYIKSKYVYYYMQAYFYNFILKNAVGSTVSSIRKGMIENFEIPIPSLKTQERIVKILDTMVHHFTQLEAELEARNKQYEYYRDKLLREEYLKKLSEKVGGEVEQKTLSDVSVYSNSKIEVSKLDINNYVGVDNLLQNKLGKCESSFVPKEGRVNLFKKGDVLLGNIRPYLRKIWIADIEGGANGDVLIFSIKDKYLDKMIPKYLYQVLADENFFEYNINYSKGAKMPRGDKKKIMEYKILVPPILVQEHIVSILDNFNKIVNDINEGLPKEIELRQKQYEYYRERLLDFKREDE